jgi:Ca2+-binding RTX toxin-like protein
MKRPALLTLLIAVVCAAPSQAATVEIAGDTLRFSAAEFEPNYPTFHYRAEDELVVYDPSFPGQPLAAGPGCAQDGDNTVICPRSLVTRAEFALADSADGDFSPDSLTLTAALPIPVSVTAKSNAGARVTYIDLRPLSVTLDGAADDGPASRGDNIGAGVDSVLGGDGTDTLTGNSRSNSLDGNNGADQLSGAGGNDTITAASYNDVGADAIGLESRGADTITCGSGVDTVYSDASDTVAADCERRVLVTENGFRFRGTAGNDRIVADRGPALIEGLGGNDRLGVSRFVGGVTISGGSGNDRVAGNREPDVLGGGSGNDLVYGAEGDDRIDGGSGRDTISAGSGADRITTRDGSSDRVTCGSGRDTVTANRSDRIARDCERVVYR